MSNERAPPMGFGTESKLRRYMGEVLLTVGVIVEYYGVIEWEPPLILLGAISSLVGFVMVVPVMGLILLLVVLKPVADADAAIREAAMQVTELGQQLQRCWRVWLDFRRRHGTAIAMVAMPIVVLGCLYVDSVREELSSGDV